MTLRSLARLLHPQSAIAFIGGAECDIAITRTRELGFSGRIWAVHPNREHLGGIPTIKSVDEITGIIDSAFIAVKREPTIDIVSTLKAKGCGGAVIYASGFAETGDSQLQEELIKAADGMPLLGPNCYGYVNGLARCALWPDEHGIEPIDKGVVIVTQSGNIACNFTFTMRGLPLAGVFAIGNQADVDMAQMVRAFAEDERITAIGLHIEGLPDAASFAAAAMAVRAARKPIVALKTGRSEQGAKVALSHTSSLAGADTLYDALFDRYGIARANSVTAFVETLKFLHHGGPLKGNRLVSMSCSGGEAALVSDMAMGRNLCFPPFPSEHKPKIAATLNEYVNIDNPLDYHTFIWNQEHKQTATYSAVLACGYDAAMLILDTPVNPKINNASWRKAARALVAAAKSTGARAVIVSSLPEGMPQELANDVAAAGVAPMVGLDDALAAFEAAVLIGENWARSDVPCPLSRPKTADGTLRTLTEAEGKALLQGFGLPVPQGQVCKINEAADVATRIGFPVTIKTSAADIAHKTEAGGVALNIRSPQEAVAATSRMAKLGPEVLVEKMVKGVVAEIIIGLKRDPQFGLALVIGAGGILTELLQDSVTLLLPTTREEVTRAVKRLKVWKLVEGYRGKSGDKKAVIDAIMAVAAFAEAHAAEIEELDINPLLVLADGAMAVDALVRIRKE